MLTVSLSARESQNSNLFLDHVQVKYITKKYYSNTLALARKVVLRIFLMKETYLEDRDKKKMRRKHAAFY